MTDNTSITKDLYSDLKDGSISSIVKLAPILLPDLPDSLRMVGGRIPEIKESIIGGSDRFVPVSSSILSTLRLRLEERSIEVFGVKMRTDRRTVMEYVEICASQHDQSCINWVDSLPVWDGIERMDDLFHDWFVSCDRGGVWTSKNFIKIMFMVPLARSIGRDTTFHSLPVIFHEPSLKPKLTQFMKAISRGGTLVQSVTPVVTPQIFAESLDMASSHALLPELMQIGCANYDSDIGRFKAIVETGQVTYRRPNVGASEGQSIPTPLLVASFPLGYDMTPPSTYMKAESRLSVMPVWFSDCPPDDLPSMETINQIYAEALSKINTLIKSERPI